MGLNNKKDYEEQLSLALQSGLIDSSVNSVEDFRPKLLTNDYKRKTRVLSALNKELLNCTEFMFSVAFITDSGLTVLLNSFDELRNKGIKGKILTSDYLYFNSPKIFRRLLSMADFIEVRISENQNFHAKGYIFKNGKNSNFIIGSSNLTQEALTRNHEWNIKINTLEKGTLTKEIEDEFSSVWDKAVELKETWIDDYEKRYNDNKIIHAEKAIEAKSDFGITLNIMQRNALESLEKLRISGKKRALLISATGTGKTYLAAFDALYSKAKKFLFIIHRENVAIRAMASFKKIVGEKFKFGLLSGNNKINVNEYDFVFATIQTIQKDQTLKSIDPEYFEYIVIDEVHRAGASSYKKIIDYFKPKFMLGMSATPERTDGANIVFELFDYNIAYEIRLQQAMEYDLLCPFHYFGISDIQVDDVEIDDLADFSHLTSEVRINHIIEKIEYYGYDGKRVKGLVFCSRNAEASELSLMFNNRGYKTVALSGKDSEDRRNEMINRLEQEENDGRLDYIFTVDIFNEGVDIPSLNQIVMLRPTQSSIVFIQQLGRGLRKLDNKEFVVVVDFIGNYENNFLIPIALSEDQSFNKDTIRRFLAKGSQVIPGCTTINFDEITRKKIYESIDKVNFNLVSFIKENYKNLKYRLGKIPSLMDFEEHNSFDLAKLFENNSLRSYYGFLKKYEKDYTVDLSEVEIKYIEFISRKLAIGKRPHELIVINDLLNGESEILDSLKLILECEYGITYSLKTETNVINVLTNKFPTGTSKDTYKECLFITKSDSTDSASYKIHSRFAELLQNKQFRELVLELIKFGLYRNRKYYGNNYKRSSLQLYQKYSYEDVCRLLEWEQNIVSLNIGGYKYDDATKTYPVFVNYHKEDDISDSIKYEDQFLSNTTLKAISKSKRTVESPDIKIAYNSKELGVNMELFVRKNKDDKGSKEFYYLGHMNTIGELKPFIMEESGLNAVELTYQLDTSVREDIYEYIIDK